MKKTDSGLWMRQAMLFLPKPVDIGQLLKLVAEHLPIKWIYQARADEQKPQDVSTMSLVAPPAKTLAALQAMVQVGDVESITDQLIEIEAMGEQYQPFVAKARGLAGQFQIQALANLLQEITLRID